MTSAVDIRDLFRVYPAPGGGVVALQGLTLDVRAGEVCVVLGPSGSGKTTLLRMLAALDRPTAGSVHAHGRDLGRLSGRARSRYRAETLGYADQHYRRALAAELAVPDLVALPLGLAGATRRERLSRAGDLLERVGLLDRARARPGELSGGEQQRVAVCAALAHRPRLFLADEPTGELDAATGQEILDLFRRLNSDGTTLLVVTHDERLAAEASRVVHMMDGRIVDDVAALHEEFERRGAHGLVVRLPVQLGVG